MVDDSIVRGSTSANIIRALIGADSLGFLSRESLYPLVGTQDRTFCNACFTGEYPIPLDEINGSFLSKQPL